MEFEEAQQYRDEYIQGKKDAGLQVSDRNGFYISSTIKDQGKTGKAIHDIHSWVMNSRVTEGFSGTVTLLRLLALELM